MIREKIEKLPFALAHEEKAGEVSFLAPFGNGRAVLVVVLPLDSSVPRYFVAPVSAENGVARYVLKSGRYFIMEFRISSGRSAEARFYFLDLLPRELGDRASRFYEIARFRRKDYRHFRNEVLFRAFRTLSFEDLKRIIEVKFRVDWVPGLEEFIDFLLKL